MRIQTDDVGVHLSWQPWMRRRKLASLAAIAAYAGAVAVLFSGAGMLTRGAALVTWEVLLWLMLVVAGAIALAVASYSKVPLPRRPDYALIASACAHSGAVPVTLLLTGETVAWLCPACDAQLPVPVADAVDTFARDAAGNAAWLSEVRRRLPDGHASDCAKCHELDWRHR